MKKKLNISSPFHIPAELHFQGYKDERAFKDFEYFWYLLVNGIYTLLILWMFLRVGFTFLS